MNADYWIQQLQLQPHPEGGYFRETYRSDESITGDSLPARYDGERSLSTAIYFLLKGDQVSAFHRIRSDELWHFHAGSPLTLHLLDGGGHRTLKLGPNPQDGAAFQHTVPRQTWFGAAVDDPQGYTLVSCTVAPGFDFRDFEMADPQQLAGEHPGHRELIYRLS